MMAKIKQGLAVDGMKACQVAVFLLQLAQSSLGALSEAVFISHPLEYMLTQLLPMLQNASSVSEDYSSKVGLGTGETLVVLAILILMIAAVWKVFTKAGQPGWAVLIPIYNAIVWLRVCGKPGWWFILLLIPVVNFIITLLASLGMAKNFGKSAAFGIGLWLLGPIFLLILAFGNAKYQGNQG
jgi:hypothetical protein